VYKVLVCGSRTFTDELPIRILLQNLRSLYYAKGTLRIIEGTADGADTIAGRIARELGLEVVEFPPDWDRYGHKAGPKRNTQMLVEGKPDFVAAFSHAIYTGTSLALTPGTQDMVHKSIRAGVPVQIYIPSQTEGRA